MFHSNKPLDEVNINQFIISNFIAWTLKSKQKKLNFDVRAVTLKVKLKLKKNHTPFQCPKSFYGI